MKGDREKFLAQGCDDYIAKPIDVPNFMKTMEKYRQE
jgi:CheY-like chemotaxis protein